MRGRGVFSRIRVASNMNSLTYAMLLMVHHRSLSPTDGRQVLRQLDIATSQTIAIKVVSGLGKVVDDYTSVSLWALGDQMVIKVWQQKVNTCYAWDLRTSCLCARGDY